MSRGEPDHAASPGEPAATAAGPDIEAVDIDGVERWLVRQGLPHLIDDYGASTDVFTRALPFLTLVLLFNVLGTFGDRFRGWSQAAVALVGGGLILGAAALVNRLRGRRALQLPNRVGPIELALFVVLPVLPAVVFGSSRLQAASLIIGGNLAVLAVVYVVVSYGLVPMTRWAIGHTVRQVSQVFVLMGRALPLVLVLSAFLFLNAELWQVAQDFTGFAFWATIGLFAAAAAAFLAVRIPREIAQIARFDSRAEIVEFASRSNSPIELDAIGTNARRTTAPVSHVDRPTTSDLERATTAELSPADRLNVALVVLFSLGVQVVLVSVVIGLFYLLFGLFAVRTNTIEQWTTVSAVADDHLLFGLRGRVFGTDIALTHALLRVVGFLAAFSGLQFSVAAVTDATYREEFFDQVTSEVREALAVRSLYLEAIGATPSSVRA